MKKIILCLFLCAQASAGLLSQGSMSIGGAGRMPLKWDSYGNMSSRIEALPSFSIFIFDQVELNAAIRVSGTLSQDENVRTPKEPLRWGAQLGVNYYFDFGVGIHPYIGFAAGADMADFKPASANLFIEVPMGLAFNVSDRFMLQVGAPVRVSFEGYGIRPGTTHVEWSPGYVGGRVFF